MIYCYQQKKLSMYVQVSATMNICLRYSQDLNNETSREVFYFLEERCLAQQRFVVVVKPFTIQIEAFLSKQQETTFPRLCKNSWCVLYTYGQLLCAFFLESFLLTRQLYIVATHKLSHSKRTENSLSNTQTNSLQIL